MLNVPSSWIWCGYKLLWLPALWQCYLLHLEKKIIFRDSLSWQQIWGAGPDLVFYWQSLPEPTFIHFSILQHSPSMLIPSAEQFCTNWWTPSSLSEETTLWSLLLNTWLNWNLTWMYELFIYCYEKKKVFIDMYTTNFPYFRVLSCLKGCRSIPGPCVCYRATLSGALSWTACPFLPWCFDE